MLATVLPRFLFSPPFRGFRSGRPTPRAQEFGRHLAEALIPTFRDLRLMEMEGDQLCSATLHILDQVLHAQLARKGSPAPTEASLETQEWFREAEAELRPILERFAADALTFGWHYPEVVALTATWTSRAIARSRGPLAPSWDDPLPMVSLS